MYRTELCIHMYMSGDKHPGDFVVLYPPSRLWPASSKQLTWQQCKLIAVIKKVIAVIKR